MKKHDSCALKSVTAKMVLRRKVRVLCLHGWRTNAKILKHQTQGLREALGERAEFLFLDAPFVASGPAQEIVQTFYAHEAPFFEWWNAVKLGECESAQLPMYRYEGVEETLEFMAARLRELAPVDVLLGFSQGAGLASMLTAHWMAQNRVRPWKACVLVSGFRPRANEVKHLFEDELGNRLTLDVPSVHIIGTADSILKQCEDLYETYQGEDIDGVKRFKFVHEEGHKFPSPYRHKALYDGVVQALDEILAGS